MQWIIENENGAEAILLFGAGIIILLGLRRYKKLGM